MRPVATNVVCSMVCVSVCLSVCLLGTRVSCVKTAEPIEMLFGGLTPVGPRNHVLDGGQDRMKPGGVNSH